MGFNSASSVSSVNPGATVSGNTYDSLAARVAEVQGILSTSSFDSYDLASATTSVVNAMTGATDDPYLRYFDESHYQTYLKDTANRYAGVGVLFGENNGQAYAVDVFSGSEAEAAGVKAGDYIVAIDGDRGSNGWTQSTAVKTIARDEGAKTWSSRGADRRRWMLRAARSTR